MPTYDYACAACGTRFEVVHGVFAEGPTACPNCGGGPVRKAFVAPTVLFKGSGWAKMDRRTAPASKGSGTNSDEAAKPSKDGAGDAATTAAPGSSSDGDSGTSGTKSSTDTSSKPASKPASSSSSSSSSSND